MRVTGYLGIDESNHGRTPEVFVGVYSTDPLDVAKARYVKGKKVASLERELDGREFSHVVVTSALRDVFSDRFLKVMAIAEIVKHYSARNLELALIDGIWYDKEFDLAREIVGSGFKLESHPRADVTYRVVNVAGRIAKSLYRYYDASSVLRSAPDHRTNPHLSHLIKPTVSLEVLVEMMKDDAQRKRKKR